MKQTVCSRFLFACVVLPFLSFPLLASPSGEDHHLTVIGQDDSIVDRANIQAAIDAAPSGATIELVGTLQLDGKAILIMRGPLTLRGRALDNDGDGEVNEDWEDGVDNDDDGAVDEDDWDTVVRGVASHDGTPAEDLSPSELFNRGFVLQGVTGTARRITIRDLRFENNHRALTIQPDVNLPTNLCEDIIATGGSATDVTLRDNLFLNNNRSIQVLGSVEDVKITRNVFIKNPNADIFLQGGLIGCIGAAGTVPLSTPRDISVSNNTLIKATIGLFARQIQNARIHHNDINIAALGISIRQSEDVTVQQNRISGAVRGLVGTQPAINTRFLDNTVVKSRDIAIILQNTATGYLLKNNYIQDSTSADVFLDLTTSGNVAIVEPTDIVVDQGTSNQIIVRSTRKD